jgi:hypothetical protein
MIVPIDIRNYFGENWVPICNDTGDEQENTGNIYIPEGDEHMYVTYKYIGDERPNIREVLINETKYGIPMNNLNKALSQYGLGATYAVPESYTTSYENYMSIVINKYLCKNDT